jgi:hypothetical protein
MLQRIDFLSHDCIWGTRFEKKYVKGTFDGKIGLRKKYLNAGHV